MVVPIKCKIEHAALSYSSNCSIFRAKKLETKSTTKENKENLKNWVGVFLNIYVRKEKEDSWLNAIKTKIAFVKGRLSFSSKGTTAANVHLVESLLDIWLKHNHITISFVCFFLKIFIFQTYFSTALIPEGAKALWHQKNYIFYKLEWTARIHTIGFRKPEKQIIQSKLKRSNFLRKLFSWS